MTELTPEEARARFDKREREYREENRRLNALEMSVRVTAALVASGFRQSTAADTCRRAEKYVAYLRDGTVPD